MLGAVVKLDVAKVQRLGKAFCRSNRDALRKRLGRQQSKTNIKK